MLSISKPFKGAGRADYYLNLAKEDYYLGGKEPPGFWLGEAAPLLGVSGKVPGDDFRNLLGGFAADRASRLVHNAGSPKRRSGWDLAWSVPKSVSVAWSQAAPEIRAVIEHEVRESVCRAIAYLESIGIVSRRGKDGVIHERAKLLFAAFEHSTSRAQDPQLHIHTILLNLGVRPDGSTGTLDPRVLFRHQLAAGALFRAELAARLERSLGLRARRDGRCFEVIGVPVTIIEEFSKRRAQIEARLRELGVFTPAAAEKAAFDTRPEKEARSRDELFPGWQEVGRRLNWSAKELGWLLHASFPARESESEAKRASEEALRALVLSDSHFGSRQLVQALAEEAQGRAMDADAVLKLHSQLLCSTQVVALQSSSEGRRWTTPELLALERHVLQVAEAMRQTERPVPDYLPIIANVVAFHPHLSHEQRRALQHVTTTAGGIRVVSGMAGTGKSTLFAAAREAWLAQDREVFGACLAGKAAQELTGATGIPAQTLHRMLNSLDRGQFTLKSNTVVLIDEAAMVGTRQMKTLFDHCAKASATVVLCGDVRQLQSIEAGGVFRELEERFGAATLENIQRQRELWARQAVRDFAHGRAAEALREFAGRGLVSLADEPAEAMRQLLADWRKETLLNPGTAVILANRTVDVITLNDRAQEERLRAGELCGPAVVIGESTFLVGDRVLFTCNDPTVGVWNGQTGTLTGVSDLGVTVRMDSGHAVSFAPSVYPHVQLGYALTTHKAQGQTVDRAFIYVDEGVETREAVYVQASRPRGLCSFYAVGETVEELVPSMARSRPKVLATTLLPAPQEGPKLTLELAC